MDVNCYSRSKLSMLLFGSYLVAVGGIGFGFFPHFTLSLLGLKAGDDTFIRIVGLLAAILGVNYFLMVKQTAIIFFKLSIVMRYLAGLFMTFLVVNGISHRNLLLLAFGDMAGATWTFVALWKDSLHEPLHKTN